jgi:hypothetical protein
LTLPDFQLEIFFSRWEFAARHNLAASDAETLTIAHCSRTATARPSRRGDRFRLGVGRRDPQPALEALAGLMDVDPG